MVRTAPAGTPAGPHPTFIDTRGLIALKSGKTDQALADFRKAVAERPTAERYFHLAAAYEGSLSRQFATDAFREASKLGLRRDSLHPEDRPLYDTLAARLPSESGPKK